MRYPIAAAALLASLPLARPALADDVSVSVRPGREVRTCDDLDIKFDDQPAVTKVERLSAPGTQKLTVHSSRNGGTYVFGGARQDFGISVCKAAAPSAGAGILDQLKADVSGGTLTATGPRSDGWLVYFIVDAPSKADIDVDATNGPIQVAQLSGTTNVRAQNGPIKLLDVNGRVNARAENGPVSYEGSGGTVELTVQNGPLAVRLAGTKWEGGSLTATAQNGPVKLQAPRGFASGVRVRSSDHSPWKCDGCDDARKTWDDDSRSVEFGTGPVAVNVSTHNGPVKVDLTK
jgi:hypothetical protein